MNRLARGRPYQISNHSWPYCHHDNAYSFAEVPLDQSWDGMGVPALAADLQWLVFVSLRYES